MELKSPSKNIWIVGGAGVIAGAAIIATNSEGFVHTFGVGILAGGATAFAAGGRFVGDTFTAPSMFP
ncbi:MULTISPECIES: hypothetical protein [unclassified Pseudomonas]|jgi:hypothetical protein|uniref:Uncharacterized protein n=1 Tax=Pseudomonas gorinensis TaxID=3240790 RepID=A0ACA7P9T2_9PSED|nr:MULTISPECIES: hypothetical protein [unclassified Pseudomonas]AHC36464.1 hypothetical protein U771_19755 [Pseudomonas sp. TKP]MBL1307204.1 hypothetical protein [Pseudomonas sp.]PMX14867.1 hypothetical protein C1Y25_13555 [Pseudomonas sp. MPBC4-3]PMX15758.1 hypothetical protein C1Y23_28280 [Pseudomonas sp. GW460-12]PMX34399.1 hypothetical protein C1Y24_14015 [Pseudomonas sp. MPR-R2A4]